MLKETFRFITSFENQCILECPFELLVDSYKKEPSEKGVSILIKPIDTRCYGIEHFIV